MDLQMKKLCFLVSLAVVATMTGCATRNNAQGETTAVCVGLPCLWKTFPDEKPTEVNKSTAVTPQADTSKPAQPVN
jgi:hypothetical protein